MRNGEEKKMKKRERGELVMAKCWSFVQQEEEEERRIVVMVQWVISFSFLNRK